MRTFIKVPGDKLEPRAGLQNGPTVVPTLPCTLTDRRFTTTEFLPRHCRVWSFPSQCARVWMWRNACMHASYQTRVFPECAPVWTDSAKGKCGFIRSSWNSCKRSRHAQVGPRVATETSLRLHLHELIELLGHCCSSVLNCRSQSGTTPWCLRGMTLCQDALGPPDATRVRL